MATHFRRIADYLTHAFTGRQIDERSRLQSNQDQIPPRVPGGSTINEEALTQRWALPALCRHIVEHAPVKPRYWFVEANMSGDKKATTHSFMTVRGKKVSAEIRLPEALVKRRLHTTPAAMVDYARMSVIGGVMSGSIGVQGHYSNGLAALFIACGQDAACVAEAAIGVTRFEIREAATPRT